MSERVRAAIATVMRGGRLTTDDAHAAMASVMDGEATAAQLSGLMLALRMRGETVDELTGFARAMRERVVPVSAPDGAIDTCGTGGDGSQTFNISTAAALLVAAAGVPVAKHGNRAMSSATGSADVLEALGIPIDHEADSAASALANHGFVFLFAPTYHPAMRHAGPVRRELGVPTAFNLLGPITNPAGVRRQVIGVADPTAAAKVANVLFRLGSERSLVVHGDGVDELPLDGTGVAYDVSRLGVRRRRVDSSALGLGVASSADLRGGDAAQNAAIIEAVLCGETGPRRDVVLLNAAAALLVAGRVRRLHDGLVLAAATIDGGRARGLLDLLRHARPQSSAA
ncbi:MAG: anthranilate phosphoribosyltransferase [Candidatus Limnocylindrales bacterium]